MDDKKKNKLYKWFLKFCAKNCIDYKTFDFEAHLDMSLTYGENKNIIKDMLKLLCKPVQALSTAEAKLLIEEAKEEVKRRATENIKRFCEIEGVPSSSFASSENIKSFLQMVIKGFSNSLFCISRAGLGKTFTVLNFLREQKINFYYTSGYITPLSLYLLLYENNGRLIVLDDVEGLFKDKIAVSILKSAVGEERLISYISTSKAIGDAPSAFNFSGKLIIMCNELNNINNENVKALLSRSIVYNFNMSHAEIIKISEALLEKEKGLSQDQKEKAIQIMKQKISITSEFNLRDYKKLISIIKFDNEKAESMFSNIFTQNEDMLLAEVIMNTNIPIEMQAKAFNEQTGLSRRTFFNYKKKINKLKGE